MSQGNWREVDYTLACITSVIYLWAQGYHLTPLTVFDST